jgi:myosin heavy subunit
MIELMNIDTTEYILLYIPHKYKFSIPSDIETFEFVRVEEQSKMVVDDIDEYIHISDSLLESSYSDVDTVMSLPEGSRRNLSMSEHLDESYKNNIILKDMKGNDTLLVNYIRRQLRRLKYCVRGMSHRISISNGRYLGVVNRDDEIDLYKCDKMRKDNIQRLYIVVDFNIFYDRINTIKPDITEIFEGIYRVLNNNQKIHSKNIKTIMERRDNILKQSDILQSAKKDYNKYIKQYTNLLKELCDYETDKMTKLDQISSLDVETGNLQHDMKRNHRIKKLQKELQELDKTKKELTKTLKDVREKHENLTLNIDSILFDNIVMLDKIFKNFDKLNFLEKQLR